MSEMRESMVFQDGPKCPNGHFMVFQDGYWVCALCYYIEKNKKDVCRGVL